MTHLNLLNQQELEFINPKDKQVIFKCHQVKQVLTAQGVVAPVMTITQLIIRLITLLLELQLTSFSNIQPNSKRFTAVSKTCTQPSHLWQQISMESELMLKVMKQQPKLQETKLKTRK